jgi:hypothetical protein
LWNANRPPVAPFRSTSTATFLHSPSVGGRALSCRLNPFCCGAVVLKNRATLPVDPFCVAYSTASVTFPPGVPTTGVYSMAEPFPLTPRKPRCGVPSVVSANSSTTSSLYHGWPNQPAGRLPSPVFMSDTHGPAPMPFCARPRSTNAFWLLRSRVYSTWPPAAGPSASLTTTPRTYRCLPAPTVLLSTSSRAGLSVFCHVNSTVFHSPAVSGMWAKASSSVFQSSCVCT